MNTANHLQQLYLEWVNNFLTRERFADYFFISVEEVVRHH